MASDSLRGRGRSALDEPFHPPLYRTPLEQHPASAGCATQADVRAEAHDFPKASAAWMELAQLDQIAEPEVDDLPHRRSADAARSAARPAATLKSRPEDAYITDREAVIRAFSPFSFDARRKASPASAPCAPTPGTRRTQS